MPVEKKILISGTEDPREISAARPKKKPCPCISIAKTYGRLLGVYPAAHPTGDVPRSPGRSSFLIKTTQPPQTARASDPARAGS